MILYGSYARGDYTPDSDIDIMILVDLSVEEMDAYSDALSELGFKYNVQHDIWMMPVVEYSCAVTPQVRQTGNRLSGLAGTAYASLLA